MRTRYRISLGGVQLDTLLQDEKDESGIADKLWILDIQYPKPETARTIESPGSRDGGIITRKFRQKVSVTVVFGLYIYDPALRNQACQKIKTWAAAGGTLRTNDRTGQALYNAVCEDFAEIDSVKNWTDPITMTFSAYAVPYWQDTTQTTKTLTGTNTSGTITPPGNAGDTNPTVSISTEYGAITWFEITTGDTTIRVTANIAKNHTVTIDYDSKRNLRIRDGSTSLLANRSAASSDELIVTCGTSNTIKIRASAKISATFNVRGRWL